MLAHDNVLATIEAIHHDHPAAGAPGRLAPAAVATCSSRRSACIYALTVGADILYVRSRNPRVIFEALRDHRVTSMVVVPAGARPVLERDRARGRQARPARRASTASARSPGTCRTRPGGSLFRSVHAQLGGGLRLFVSPGAFLPPALQQALGGPRRRRPPGLRRTENGFGTCTTPRGPRPRDGRPADAAGRDRGSPTTARSSSAARRSSRATGSDPEATAAAFTADGWYRTGDIGHLDAGGRLILSGRTKDIIVLPNGFNVYPEDIENALRIAGIRDSVVARDGAGPDRGDRPPRRGAGVGDGRRRRSRSIDAAVKAANATPRPEPADRGLAAVAGGRLPADPHAQGQARPGPRLDRGLRGPPPQPAPSPSPARVRPDPPRVPARGERLAHRAQPGEVAVLADDLAEPEQVELPADLVRGADDRERDPAIPEPAGDVDDRPAAGVVDVVHRIGEEGEPARRARAVRERADLVGEARGVREEQPDGEAIDDQPGLGDDARERPGRGSGVPGVVPGDDRVVRLVVAPDVVRAPTGRSRGGCPARRRG